MASNEYLKGGFELWQQVTDLAFELTQRSLDQSFALRERLDEVVADSVKKAEALSAREQEIALGAAEAVYAQAQTASKRVAEMFAPSAKK